METTKLGAIAVAVAVLLAGCDDGGGGGPDEDSGADVVEEPEPDGEDATDVPADTALDEVEDIEDADDGVDVEAEVPDEPDPEWERFVAAREGYLVELGEPILACVVEEDTDHPAFHGCIDWHSAVEGAWALHVLARLTGDTTYVDAYEAMLGPDEIADELAILEGGGPSPSELPYGYSWFLALGVERERAGYTDLVPLADVVCDELVIYVTGLTRTRIDGAIRAPDYENLSWNVLNIWQHAVYRGDDALAAQMEDFTRVEILTREILCPLSRTPADVNDFFAPCMHRARLILTVLPEEDTAAWVETSIPEEFELDPIAEPAYPHSAGLNFSRAWDLLPLWEATGDPAYRQTYIDHIEFHMAMPEYWRDDYLYSHWIPQFGVYALVQGWD